MLHDVDGSVAEIHWAAEHGLTGGVLLPGAPPGSGVPPLYAPDYEPIWTACEEVGLPINHHSGSAAPDYRRLPGGAGDVPARGHVVGPSHALAPDLLRRDGAPPEPAVRVHRAGHRVGCPTSCCASTTTATDCAGVGGAGGSQEAKFGESTARAVARNRRSTGPGSATSGRASSDGPRSTSATRSASTGSCGAATSRTSKGAGRTRAATCGSRSPAYPRTRSGPWSAATPRRCTASTSTRSSRWPPSSGRRPPRSPSPLDPATSPTRRCAVLRSPPRASSDGGLMKDFDGRVAVITGGAGGIGKALGERFAAGGHERRAGRRVPRPARRGRRRTRGAGPRRDGVVTDVTDFASVEHLRDEAYATYGAVHVLCNNAGVGAGAEGQDLGPHRSTTGTGAWR